MYLVKVSEKFGDKQVQGEFEFESLYKASCYARKIYLNRVYHVAIFMNEDVIFDSMEMTLANGKAYLRNLMGLSK